MLICYYDPFTKEWVYEWIDGVIYRMQEGSRDWQQTLAYIMTTHLEFKKIKNMESMFFLVSHTMSLTWHFRL